MDVPEIEDVDVAFPARALEWMPPMESIPQEFKERGTEWNGVMSVWFYRGLPAEVAFFPKQGVDPQKAIRAIQATLGSYAPKHQHKMAATAYMLSCWFDSIENWLEDS